MSLLLHKPAHPLKSTLPVQAIKARGSGDSVAGVGRLRNGTINLTRITQRESQPGAERTGSQMQELFEKAREQAGV